MAEAKHRLNKKERAKTKQRERDDKARTAQEEHRKSSSHINQGEEDDTDSEFEDDDEDGDPTNNTIITTSGKEPPSKFLLGLAVANTLLEKDGLAGSVTEDVARDALFEPNRFSSNENEAGDRLLNLLRPYTPKKSESGVNAYPKSVLFCGPFVYITNAILRACCYKDFSRRICPVYSIGHRRSDSVPLAASAMYEVFGRRKANHFDIRGPNDRLITSTTLLTTYVVAMDLLLRKDTPPAAPMMRKKHIRLPGVRRSIEELEQSGLTNHTAQTSTEEAKLKQEDLNRRVAPLRTSLKAALISQRDADSAVRSQKTAGKRV
ncbi:hypothetical protein BGZ97_010299 [Linnemannia gamsii]|uniref:Uncharacterized protein n=1 Tax=Linnemannia gamsii TaxID=64522 RepID=A0A9P6UP84_9FUNG|nr:hypothetical protein BGZ97_010299 [Linnemannia gamsii]